VKEANLRFAVTITFRTSNKNSPLYSSCWKCCPPGRMHSLQLRKTFTLWSSLEIVSLALDVSEFFQGVFLQVDHIPSKSELSFSFKVAVVTILRPFVQTFRKTRLLSLEIFCDIFQQPHIWNRAVLKTGVVQQCTWVQACYYSTEKLRNAFTSKKTDDSWCESVIVNS